MNLYLVRGLPGSGKSTFAATLSGALRAPHFEHDMYLYTPEGEYLWTEERMAYAWRQCLRDTEQKMSLEFPAIIVSNVFPNGKAMRPYRKLADSYGYNITYVVVENRRGGVNVHDVPEEALAHMRSIFQVTL